MRHLQGAVVHSPIQNIHVAQSVNRKHIQDNARDQTKSLKVKAPNFDERRDPDFLSQLN